LFSYHVFVLVSFLYSHHAFVFVSFFIFNHPYIVVSFSVFLPCVWHCFFLDSYCAFVFFCIITMCLSLSLFVFLPHICPCLSLILLPRVDRCHLKKYFYHFNFHIVFFVRF
jgi:hypothetical protein